MQIQVTNIHRRSNGTVDTDVYRRKAFLLRRETTNRILRRLGNRQREFQRGYWLLFEDRGHP